MRIYSRQLTKLRELDPWGTFKSGKVRESVTDGALSAIFRFAGRKNRFFFSSSKDGRTNDERETIATSVRKSGAPTSVFVQTYDVCWCFHRLTAFSSSAEIHDFGRLSSDFGDASRSGTPKITNSSTSPRRGKRFSSRKSMKHQPSASHSLRWNFSLFSSSCLPSVPAKFFSSLAFPGQINHFSGHF